MLQIVSVCDLVTVYLKLYFDGVFKAVFWYICLHPFPNHWVQLETVAALQVMNVFMGEEGKELPSLSVDIAFWYCVDAEMLAGCFFSLYKL